MNVEFIEVAVSLVLTVVFVGLVIAWRALREQARGSRFEEFILTVEAFVEAAEQTMRESTGQDKLAWVMGELSKIYPQYNWDFIRAFVESAVRKMKVGGGG